MNIRFIITALFLGFISHHSFAGQKTLPARAERSLPRLPPTKMILKKPVRPTRRVSEELEAVIYDYDSAIASREVRLKIKTARRIAKVFCKKMIPPIGRREFGMQDHLSDGTIVDICTVQETERRKPEDSKWCYRLEDGTRVEEEAFNAIHFGDTGGTKRSREKTPKTNSSKSVKQSKKS